MYPTCKYCSNPFTNSRSPWSDYSKEMYCHENHTPVELDSSITNLESGYSIAKNPKIIKVPVWVILFYVITFIWAVSSILFTPNKSRSRKK